MKRIGLLALFVLLFAAAPLRATNVGGVISTNTTWTLAGSPYILTNTVSIGGDNAPTLTIQAGVVVKANANVGLAVTHRGALVVNGTASQPVLFTSNGAQSPGSWAGIVWGQSSVTAPPSRISHAIVEYAGYAPWSRGAVVVSRENSASQHLLEHVMIRNSLAGFTLEGGSATLTDCQITSNTGPGIHASATSGALALHNNAITNNDGYAVTLPLGVTLTASGNTASRNGDGRNGIEYRTGTIASNMTWPAAGIPYIISGSMRVWGAGAPVLTIAAGATVRFNADAELACNVSNKGAIQAVGTAAAPILFTSNGAATQGAWRGLNFGSHAGGPQSNLTHATVEHAGSTSQSRGGILIESSVILDRVTVRNNAKAGITLRSGAPSISNSSIASNGGPGIQATAATSLTLNGNSFTGNSGYAATLRVDIPVLSNGGNTASDNGVGGDAIEYSAGTIAVNTLWPATGIPYAVSGEISVRGAAAPVLRIAAGNTIRFNSGAHLACNSTSSGAIRAIGTAAAPILFTTNGSPIPGYWRGITFGPGADPPFSRIAFATIEYGGGSGNGGINVQGSSPQFDQVTLRNNPYGIHVSGTGSPRIASSNFYGNTDGGLYLASTASAHAALNYWGSPAGPCVFPATCAPGQQSVRGATVYEPWLVSAPTVPLYFASALHKNVSFNPALGTTTTLEYSTSIAASAVMTVRNASNDVIRTLSASGTSGALVWDGKNTAGTVQPDGTYTYEVAATAAPNPPAVIARGFTTIDSTLALTLSNLAWSDNFFSPNADAVQDSSTLTGRASYDDAAWTITILHPTLRYVVRTASGTGAAISFTWDGKEDSGLTAEDSAYIATVRLSVGTVTARGDATTTVDNTPPENIITAPVPATVLSNVYTDSTDVPVTGKAWDLNLLNWRLEFNVAPNTGYIHLTSGTEPVDGALGTWQSGNYNNDDYNLRLTASDEAGNVSATIVPVTLAHFKATQVLHEFNAASGGTIPYTSFVPFPLTQTVHIRNEGGAVVRTLVSAASRNAGQYVDVFDGRNDSGVLLPDGPYFYTTDLVTHGNVFTWDKGDVMLNYSSYNDGLNIADYDPFDNKPLWFEYTFNRPGRVTVATSTNWPGSIHGECDQPTDTFFCAEFEVWQESGAHQFYWWGIDHTGSYRAIKNLGLVSLADKFPINAAVLFGTKPKVRDVRVTPTVFGPEFDRQVISFHLTTYQNQNAFVEIAITSLDTKSTLRTIARELSPGPITVTWNGLGDNGHYVAPGRYSVVITARDALGNRVQNGILTTIQY